jgi:positive regulator of sigma E activity
MTTLLFLLGGFWVDGKLGTVPILTILGAFVGGAAGFYSMYRHMVIEPRRKAGQGEQEEKEG